MISIRDFSVKTAACAIFFGTILSSVPAFSQGAGQAAGPAAPADASRKGVPSTYHGPMSAVAAIVNDHVITTYDVQQRVTLMLMSSGGKVTPEMLPQLQTQAVRDLVEDQLKSEEIAKFKVPVDDSEVNDHLQGMISQSRVTPQQFEAELKQHGVSIDTLKKEIRTSIGWMNLVQGRFRDRVRVDQDQVDDTLERMREDAKKEQYLVSEICIPVPEPSKAQEYYNASLSLIEQMRKGVPFAAVAHQFSACPSAASGGDLGWLHAGELPKELDEAIRALPPGSVTNPIPSEGAFMIMAVRDKRPAVVPGEPSWTLVYASAPESVGRNKALTELQKIKTADACGSSQRLDLGPDVSVALQENMKLSDIDPRFRSAVDGLGRGDMSGIVEADGAYHMVYVCDKDEGLGLPSRSAIEDRLYSRQLSQIAQQYLRDIERKSMVDIRLKSQETPNG